MSPFALDLLKFIFLALLYVFVYRAIRSIVIQVRGAPGSGAGGGRERAGAAVGMGASHPGPRAPSRNRGKPPKKLVLLGTNGRKGEAYPLEGTLQVGRAAACHVKVEDTYVSQFHARIFARDGAWFVEDLGSTNGTYLNQRKVTTPSELHTGDELRVGKTVLEVRT